jgi:hypothetical protein
VPDVPNITDIPDVPDVPDATGNVVIVNGVDITGNLNIIEIGGVLFAEGRTFIASILVSDDPEYDYPVYTYLFEDDHDEIYHWLSEYEIDRGEYLNEDFYHLLGMDAIIISSWFTDTPIFILFIDSTDFVRFYGGGMGASSGLQNISAAPRYHNGDVYIPIEAFLRLSANEYLIR